MSNDFNDELEYPVSKHWKPNTPFFIRYAKYSLWETWFAWFPVCSEQGKYIWLRNTNRRAVHPNDNNVDSFMQYSDTCKGRWDK